MDPMKLLRVLAKATSLGLSRDHEPGRDVVSIRFEDREDAIYAFSELGDLGHLLGDDEDEEVEAFD